MYTSSQSLFEAELAGIKEASLYKRERVIESPQQAKILVAGKEVINFCANNYLGLANNKVLCEAAKRAIDEYGLGLASVRFICGTQTIHKEFERRIAEFLRCDDAILYTSCFDANGGLFETLLGEEDAVISDALNHASIIDGIRLCKAQRFRYANGDMNELEDCLKKAREAKTRKMLIATDGVFSMDGAIAKLKEICDLADRYSALVMIDECHATGFFGPSGRGSFEHCDVVGRVDIINSTLGKALGGAVGGFTAARKEIVDLLRQRSRPYLFSNSLPPSLVAAGIACLDLISNDTALRAKLQENTAYFRKKIAEAGFSIKPGIHPIVPIMLGDASIAVAMADKLLARDIYVIGFSFPVVPKGQARIRVQLSAAHSRADIDKAVAAFKAAGMELGVVKG